MRGRGLVSLVATWMLVLTGCTAGTPPASTAVSVSSATTTVEPYQLSFVLQQATFAERDIVDGLASLVATDGGDHEVCGAIGGLFAFSYLEVGGTRRMDAARDYGAAPYTVASDPPMTSHLRKSGGWTPDDPNAAFYQQWVDDPELRLPAGTWEITAWVQLFDGNCNEITPGDVRDLRATVRVTITR